MVSKMVYVPNPQQPFSVTVKLEVGDLFQSLTDGYVVDPGSISADDTFWPADGSPKTENSQTLLERSAAVGPSDFAWPQSRATPRAS